MPFEENLGAFRNVPWGGDAGDQDFVFLGENLAGATFHMQIRTERGDRTSPLIDLTNAIAGVNGLSWVWDAGYLDPETGATVGATIVTPFILDTTLNSFPWPPRQSDPIVFYYDLTVTKVGDIERLVWFGTWTLYPGVTR